MTKLTDWLEKQEKMLEGVTEGPWTALGLVPKIIKRDLDLDISISHLDAEFIANSRTALPQALKVIRELNKVLEFYSGHALHNAQTQEYQHIAAALMDDGIKAREAINLDPEEL